jgi:PAS domain-containing protein
MPQTLLPNRLPTHRPAGVGTQASAQADERWSERLARLLESAGEGMYGVDMEGRCVFINRAAAAMLGYAPKEALQRNIHELIHHSHPDGRRYPESECPMFAAFREGRPCRIDDEVLWRRTAARLPWSIRRSRSSSSAPTAR